MMDALNFLKKQHREVEALFKKAIQASEPTERLNLFKQIDRDLRIHSMIEEAIFYPELKRRLDKSEERLQVAEAYEEHGLVKMTIESLEKLDPGTEQYQAKLVVLNDLVQHHVDEEESTMFKMAHHVFEKPELEELGVRMEEAAAQAATPV
ncbi:MAG TPA: hemerythrin domain-containing protein [Candidatus Baltobacteraceae bacterium]|nr:hemerythrin domain-containing protein [Candidatus Baltobacteraceae bacterium]